MNHVVKEAISIGIPPIKAIQMATINPASYLGVEGDLGCIAPGRFAVVLLVKDIRDPNPYLVVANGEVVARDNVLSSYTPFETPIPDATPGWVGVIRSKGFTPDVFQIEAEPGSSFIEMPIIEIRDKTIT